VALDIGGGSLQLVHVKGRQELDAQSWAIGAVRMTERFLPDEKAKKSQVEDLRKHVRGAFESAPWLKGAAERGERIAGIGGALRNLATAAELEGELPSFGVQGFTLRKKALSKLVEELADLPASERGAVPGIKKERGDLILAAAVVIEEVLDAGGFDEIETTEEGLREGVFFSILLEDRDPPLFDDVRQSSVLNLALQFHPEPEHTRHVAQLALELWDQLEQVGLHDGDAEERELLWAAAVLHDIGTAVDYDDHHRHSQYLVLNAGLPGWALRETVLIAQMVRYHRKGTPTLAEFEPLTEEGDDQILLRCAAILRLAEQFERARDQAVKTAHVAVDDGKVELTIEADEDVSLARWAAERTGDVFKSAFGRELKVS
jgi:exopolyphosphatase/guanosine-5'-triphosphate,3'-diphosphate pyrophosphatase